MKKTLYISDLDGTLLNRQAELSSYTVSTLNKLIDNGMQFSIATARTAETALKMIANVKTTTPVVLMNGVCVYDTQAESYLKVEVIEKSSVIKMVEVLKKNNQTGFLYTMQNDRLMTYYENLDAPHMNSFYFERVKKFNKPFTKVETFFDCINLDIIYFSVAEKKEKLEPIFEQLKLDKKINVEFYRDIYEEDFWYMEISSHAASKYNAVKFLREQYDFDKVISFGDNLNDIPMFKASEEGYAVSNAKDEVKAKATAVIEGNTSDGVVRWLEANVK